MSAEHIRAFTAEEVKTELDRNRFDSGTARFGVDTYRLVYRTIDPDGHATTASGLLALPKNGERNLRSVAFEHGTIPAKAVGPSVSQPGYELAATITYASAGFAGITPDYLGLGLGPGQHPYMDVPSETTASVDMLRASRAFATGIDRQLDYEVYVAGFSQGGPAAMSLARTLQGGADDWFRAASVAAISGPYDIEATALTALLNDSLDPISGVFYIAYLLVAWDRLHDLYQSPSEVFQAPYDATAPQLFGGSHSQQEIVAGLPTSLDKLLTPHALDMLHNPSGEFAAALQIADSTCRDWTSRIPIRLYTSSTDRDVLTANSVRCQALLRDGGIDAPIIDVGAVNHLDAGRAGIAAAVRWFLESAAAG